MVKLCGGCKKQAEGDSPIFRCDGCTSYWCRDCGDLSSSEIKVLQLKGSRVMKFFCVNCLNYNTANLMRDIIQNKDETIAAKEKIIELLERELSEGRELIGQCRGEICTESNVRRSYASVAAKGGPRTGENVPCIVVKPKGRQSSAETRAELQSKIKPTKISVGINMVKEIKDGGVLLKCDSKRSTEKMKEETERMLGENYTISETKLLNPCVTVSNISGEMSKEDVVEAIRVQNVFLGDADNFKLKVLKKARNNKSLYAVLECNGSCYQKMMGSRRINIGFNKCPIYENINLIRCYKCCRFNHLARDCSISKEVCTKCAGDHLSKNCLGSDRKCANCAYYNSRFGCNFDTQHEAVDINCSVYKQKVGLIKQRINYKTVEV